MRAVDSGKVSILVLLDLNATFDTVDHNILLSVLRDQFSIEDTAYDWFPHISQTATNHLSTMINKLLSFTVLH